MYNERYLVLMFTSKIDKKSTASYLSLVLCILIGFIEQYSNKVAVLYVKFVSNCLTYGCVSKMLISRGAILELFTQATDQCKIVFSLGVSKRAVSDAISGFSELGHENDRLGLSRKLTVNTLRNRAIIKKRVHRNCMGLHKKDCS